MPGFYYWFPIERDKLVNERAGRLNLDSLAGFDAAYIFEGRDVVPDQTVWMSTDGPGGNIGTLLYPKPIGETELPKCFYDPDSRHWVRFKGYWIGCEKDQVPRPEDLERRVIISGWDITDQNDHVWKCPTIRRREGKRTFLPHTSTFDENGEFVTKLHPSVQNAWDLAGVAIDMLLCKKAYTDENINRMTVQFLSVNYYLGIGEVHAWGTFGRIFLETSFVANVFGVATDWIHVQDYEEKKTTELA